MERWHMCLAAGALVVVPLAIASPTAAAQGLPPQFQAPGTPQAGALRPRLRERFAAANTTHDGRLTLAQAQAGGMRGVARNFDAIDADRKGYVTVADIRAFRRARRAERQTAPRVAAPLPSEPAPQP